jgi:hypothetical protein
MSRILCRSLFLAALLLSTLAVTAMPNSHVRVVRLSYVNGDVQLDRATGNGYEPALLNMPIVQHSALVTGADGEAEIEFENGSTLRLTPDTQISFTELSLTDGGQRVTHIHLDQGLAYLALNKKDGDFQLEANGHAITPKKSTRLRLDSDSDGLSVAIFDGGAEVHGGAQGTITVQKDESLTLDVGDTDRYFLAKNIESDPYDSWDAQRDSTRASLVAQQPNSGGNYYGPDLGAYGSWYDSQYGSVWQPNGVAYDWSPYADGSWAWYPSYGWNWVSAYPWGFVPYHYGSWVFVNGRGWCWRRPQNWNGWNNISNLYANGHPTGIIPPNGNPTGVLPSNNGFLPRPPARPVHGGDPTIVAVGRGPRVEWRDPEVRNGRRINPNSFRAADTSPAGPAPTPSLVLQNGIITNERRAPVVNGSSAPVVVTPNQTEEIREARRAEIQRGTQINPGAATAVPDRMPRPMPMPNRAPAAGVAPRPMPQASPAPAGTGMMRTAPAPSVPAMRSFGPPPAPAAHPSGGFSGGARVNPK